MASLERRSRHFRIVFRYAGVKFCRALKTCNEREARTALARLEDNLRRMELGIVVLPDGADVPTFLLSDGRLPTRPQLPAIRTLAALFDKYFDAIPENSIEGTTKAGMKMHERHFRRILRADFPIQTLDLLHLQQYVEERSRAPGRRNDKLSTATIKKELRTLATVWSWALHAGLISKPFPKRGLRFPKTTEKLPFLTWKEVETRVQRGDLTDKEQDELWDTAFLTLADITELLSYVKQAARYPFIYPMFVFAAHTGARRSEIIRSRVDDIDFRSETVLIHEKKRVRGKLSTRRAPLSPLLQNALGDWLNGHLGGQYTFCKGQELPSSSKRGGELDPLTPYEAQHHFNATLADSKWARLRGWHILRHSFCSNCAASGVDQRVINAWVGHQTEEMVKRYRHLLPNQQHDAMRMVFGS